MQVHSLGREDSWRREWNSTPAFLPEESHGQRSLVGCSPQGRRVRHYRATSLLGGSDSKEFACSAGDHGLISGSGRSPAEANGNPFQYSCQENSMDRGAWWATIHGLTESDTSYQLNNN